MRQPSFLLGLPVLVMIGLGCGDDTNTTGGNGTGAGNVGGSSAGGNNTGAGNTGGAGANGIGGANTGGTTTTGGNGTGGAAGNACEQACNFAGSCGLPVDQCLTLLDCTNPQGECAANCVNQPGVDCAALLGAVQGTPGPLTDCVTGCQGAGGGGMGGGGVGGGGVGGGAPQACQDCGTQNCAMAFFACAQQSSQQACQDWITCAQGCNDAACVDACTAATPSGAGLEQCLCTTCNADCAPLCN